MNARHALSVSLLLAPAAARAQDAAHDYGAFTASRGAVVVVTGSALGAGTR